MPCRGPESSEQEYYNSELKEKCRILESQARTLKQELDKVIRLLCQVCEDSKHNSPLCLTQETEEWYKVHSKFDKQRLNYVSKELIAAAKKLGYELSEPELKKILK